MNGFELALLRRNARLRAWRSYGVPIEGGWELHWSGLAWVRLSCQRCQDRRLEQPGHTSRGLAAAEAIALRRAAAQGCPHLAPLLEEDPLEVQAITELELLGNP
jgi:hypothetical protein